MVVMPSFATVDTTVTSKSYVDNTFQTKIPAGTNGSIVTYNGTDANGQTKFSSKALTHNINYGSPQMVLMGQIPSAAALLTLKNQITDVAEVADNALADAADAASAVTVAKQRADDAYVLANTAATAASVALDTKQDKLLANDDTTYPNGSIVTYGTLGTPGTRGIVTSLGSDATATTIPTTGAIITALNARVPTGTANTLANYDANGALGTGVATYDGSTTYNATNDAAKIATAAFVETKANKMTCAGWPDGAAHTDANCWLWTIND